MLFRLATQVMKRRILQQHDCFPIPDFPGADHVHCLRKWQFQHFYIFLFGFQSSAFVNFQLFRVCGHKKIQDLGNRARRHIRFKYLLHRGYLVTGFLHRFPADAFFRIIFIQQTGTAFYQQPRFIAIDIGRHAELPR